MTRIEITEKHSFNNKHDSAPGERKLSDIESKSSFDSSDLSEESDSVKLVRERKAVPYKQ
ncbi:23868_t:CDS:2 [Gigaspora rosea]|nr:23868_t:CDS:2 [Gigaspora rosea]